MKQTLLFLFFFSFLLSAQQYISKIENSNTPFFGPQIQPNSAVTTIPTFGEQPKPEEVLVVYRDQNPVSASVKNYYCNKRNIPQQNQVGVYLPQFKYYGADIAELIDNDEIIRSYEDSLAFVYYSEFIADKIKQHLNSNYTNDGRLLKDAIRYIVLCKGIPLKIQTHDRFTNEFIRLNIAIDGLLTVLYNDPVYFFRISMLNPTLNPYYNVDPDLTLDYRFMPNHFAGIDGWKLQYLVSRIDGHNYTDVIGLIDRLSMPDRSGNAYWVLDADTCHNKVVTRVIHNYGFLRKAQEKLIQLGMKTNPPQYDPDCNWILNMSAIDEQGKVICYSSCGWHSWIQCGSSIDYIIDCLNFDYANGAVFNTFESYNGNSMDINYKFFDFALISEFVKMGGSGGVAYPWEPSIFGMAENKVFLPAYAVGYNMVDAAYMSLPYFVWNYIIVGDPFCTIAYSGLRPDNDITIDEPSLFTGPVYIPNGITLTVTGNAVINLRHHGSIIIEGGLVIEPGAEFTFANGNELIISDSAQISSAFDSISFSGNGTISTAQQLSFNDCTFKGVSIEVLDTPDASLSVTGSKFFLQDTAIINYSLDTIEAEGNWWGHMSGPHHQYGNPSGMGVKVVGNIRFNPFIRHYAQIPIDFTLSDNKGNVTIVTLGLDPDANFDIDEHLGEYALPDSIPANTLFAGFNISYPQVYSYVDYRRGNTQSTLYKTYKLFVQRALPNSDYTLSWTLPDSISMLLKDDINGSYIYETYGSGTDSFTVTNSAVDKLQLKIFYNIPVSADENSSGAPEEYQLYPNYPNPFNPSTTISYALPEAGYILLEIFSASGERIRVLEDSYQTAGLHSVIFDAAGLSSGVYFYRLTSGTFTDTKKLLLMK